MRRHQPGSSALCGGRHFKAITICTACLAGALLIPALNATPALADEKDGLPEQSIATSLDGGPDKDARAALAAKGVTYGINYIGEVWTNSGGREDVTTYLGRLEILVDADLEKLWGPKGLTFHVNGYQIHGAGLEKYLGYPLDFISSIEALPSSRLFELWLEQKFGERVSVRAGQLAVDSEFMTSETAGKFLNSSFGWPAIWSTDLPNGGNAYPLATPGARVKVEMTDKLTFLGAIYNGNPAGCLDGQRCNRNGIDFRTQDPPFVIEEVQYKYNQRAKGVEKDGGNKGKENASTDLLSLPGIIKFGAWQHFDNFRDVYSGTLIDADINVSPRGFWGNYGFYALVDQQIYRLANDPENGVFVFTRIAAAPSERNIVSFYIDGGVFFRGFVPGRSEDTFGAAQTYVQVSGDASDADRYIADYTDPSYRVRNFEAVAEVFYKFQIAPGFAVQPDLQYMWNPGGGIAENKDAVYGGVRVSIAY
ncbi:Carbohydrate-selective porin OprB [Rhodomicrobium vannielii ATCC 17100]|uniref:Carbohydrate-selective porin OprB n=1 Tax=Rhodomicrobium vannielii (strain ATCC 17100 / DSM 162 / LMG 4299 / NCIMB 10020 / ATH 3.1.1) TaxID=648757 RepID=E3I261_RHOVT|nr:carbohydrate porin [Rhodomicrobium vannielii]ADP72448.1 Carbohydrate-selective porin OprB [Rhodomicrobium vannielii ATCC 17100]